MFFLNLEFLRRIAPYLREARVLAIDGTFGVIPRVPADIEQLVTIHAILDNVVSDLLTLDNYFTNMFGLFDFLQFTFVIKVSSCSICSTQS